MHNATDADADADGGESWATLLQSSVGAAEATGTAAPIRHFTLYFVEPPSSLENRLNGLSFARRDVSSVVFGPFDMNRSK